MSKWARWAGYRVYLHRFRSRDSSVGVDIGYAGRWGLNSQQGQHFLLFSAASRPALWPTQSLIQWVPGGIYPGVKRQGSEAEH
jgi:hypothetical protein